MAKADTSRIEALEAVLAEKRKHEGYLAKLEERRASTPANVFARLRDEYLTKLTDLQVRASIESESLSESLKEDEVAVTDIEAKLAAITEERLEGELRAEVGEYDPKEWAEKLKSLNAGVSRIEKERDLKVASFERTRALLFEARGSVPAAAATATPEPVPAAAAAPAARPTPHALPAQPTPGARVSAAEAMPAVSAAAAPPAARIVTPVPPPPVVRVPTPVAPVASVPAEAVAPPSAPEPTTAPQPVAESAPVEAPAAPKAAPGPMSGSPSFDELAFLNSVVGRASTPMRAEPPSPRPSRPMNEVRDSAKTPIAPPAVQVPRATTAKVTEPIEEETGPLGRPTPRTSQAIKTLKCQECGTLNYPTEWYCERCGGELAAL